ncbi:MAG TPA: MgtC/SapB family protein [Phycisphaerales bacterium]|nr:MgtC/SapB family protein [Phycisphaerales bacterium]
MVGFDEIISLVVALVLGGAIGFERELGGKPAGLRTNIIICLGACAFTIISQHLAQGNPDAATRIVAGIVTGVGFLGAGALIQAGSGVHGMTTAASIWLVTSIGVACGVQMYVTATTVTGLALAVLFGLLPLTRRIRHKNQRAGDVPQRRTPDDQNPPPAPPSGP